MDWYAVQVITGKEPEVLPALRDAGVELLEPVAPMFIKRGGEIRLSCRPLIPGYVFAKLDITDFYKYQRSSRLERMMIRLCGNGRDPVPLMQQELDFLSLCSGCLQPLCLREICYGIYDIVNSPPWAKDLYIEYYDSRQFEAKISNQSGNFLRGHSFKIAAYLECYQGKFSEQLKDLQGSDFDRFNGAAGQAVTQGSMALV